MSAAKRTGGIVSHCMGTDSEIGFLRTVLMHRPGAEMKRITPRTKDRLGFASIPWLSKAQQEHDALTDVLRERGAEVLYLTELLQDVLEYSAAREASIASVLACADFGKELGRAVSGYLAGLPPEDLAAALIAGLTRDELRSQRRGLVCELLDPRDFLVEPLPNLVFSGDAGVWIYDEFVVARLPARRRRETDLLNVVYAHHPRFARSARRFQAGRGALDGGDILLLAPGVVAVGVGVHTTPACVERLAGHLLDAGVAHTVLAVPMNQHGGDGHLDRVCTVVDTGTVIMVPATAFTLTALTVTQRLGELCVSRPRPFLEAAALATGIDAIKVIDTGLDSRVGPPGQWDDGSNVLALGQRVTVSSERNSVTNARLEAAGFEVVGVPFSELGAMRGGPRSMCSPIERDPVQVASSSTMTASLPAGLMVARHAAAAPPDGVGVPSPAAPAEPAGGTTRRGELTASR